ncbi:Putative arsenite methyltransferase [uncultured archaeon]|nr:Putative arsenite methyltransferase [uncultured archaeon]
MGIKESAIKQFGRQAEAYSKGNIFVDGVHLSEVVKRSGVAKNHRILDIATGSGFLALEFAKFADSVIGADLTRNMLLYARERQKSSGLGNTGFLLSDVESLPFPDGSFDIVSCRFAFHHFPSPGKALLEMKRICRTHGRIVLVDGVSSEDREKSLFHNRIEKLRDPSHVRIYMLSEIKNMFNKIGAAVIDLTHWDIPQEFEEWMKRAGTDRERKGIIEGLMRQGMDGDRTGLRVKIENGRLGFTYDTVILIADVGR